MHAHSKCYKERQSREGEQVREWVNASVILDRGVRKGFIEKAVLRHRPENRERNSHVRTSGDEHTK